MNVIIPADDANMEPEQFSRRAIKLQEILNNIADRNPFVVIFFLDCNRGYVLRNHKLDARSPGSSGGLKPMVSCAGSLIAFACAPGCITCDDSEQENSLFTKHLLRHIKTPNEDIHILLTRVNGEVIEESNACQIPYFCSSLRKSPVCLFEQPQG